MFLNFILSFVKFTDRKIVLREIGMSWINSFSWVYAFVKKVICEVRFVKMDGNDKKNSLKNYIFEILRSTNNGTQCRSYIRSRHCIRLVSATYTNRTTKVRRASLEWILSKKQVFNFICILKLNFTFLVTQTSCHIKSFWNNISEF